jgi:hypothetical protein
MKPYRTGKRSRRLIISAPRQCVGVLDEGQCTCPRGTLASCARMELGGVNDQFFFGKELERAVSFHIDGVSNVAFNRWKNGNYCADLMVVGCIIDFLANRKLRHRKLLLESSMRVYHRLKHNSLMLRSE